jgi:hypothetical protein
VLDGQIEPVMTRKDGTVIGWGREDAMVWGTYLHGVFDADGFRRSFLDRLRVRKGIAPLNTVQVAYDLEAALDRLGPGGAGESRHGAGLSSAGLMAPVQSSFNTRFTLVS